LKYSEKTKHHHLIKVLPKKGDVSASGNYRGIMLLETAYKIAFRPGRGCADGVFHKDDNEKEKGT
jgi:hypothetical protein